MSQQPQVFDVKSATIPQVIDEVASGRLSPEDALKLENATEPVRATLVEKLENLAKPVTDDPPAPSVAPLVQNANPNAEAEAIANPNGYEKAKLMTSKQVQRNTGGNGSYFDPEMKQSVGKEPVDVYVTPLIDGLMRTKELVKAR